MEKSIVGRYSEVIKNHPLLSRKEEIEIFRTLHKYKSGNKKQEARDKIFNSNLALVMKYAYQYSRVSEVSVEDLVSAGNEGLGMAIDGFNYKMGNKFSTYAVPYIRLRIFRSLRIMGKIVSVPPHILEKSRKYRSIMGDSSEVKLSEKELKKRMHITEKVFSNIKASQMKIVYLDKPVCRTDENQESLANVMPDSKAVLANRFLVIKEKDKMVHAIVDRLPDIDRKIIEARYLLPQKVNLLEIGKKLRITGERVRQIEVKALRKLRFKLRQNGYTKFEQVSCDC